MNPLLLSAEVDADFMNKIHTVLGLNILIIGLVVVINLAVIIGLIVFIVKSIKKSKSNS